MADENKPVTEDSLDKWIKEHPEIFDGKPMNRARALYLKYKHLADINGVVILGEDGRGRDFAEEDRLKAEEIERKKIDKLIKENPYVVGQVLLLYPPTNDLKEKIETIASQVNDLSGTVRNGVKLAYQDIYAPDNVSTNVNKEEKLKQEQLKYRQTKSRKLLKKTPK